MFVYNHKQSEWRELAAMKTARAMFGAVVHNGKIVVAGGVNEEGLTAASEVYDFGTNKYVAFPLVINQFKNLLHLLISFTITTPFAGSGW